MRLEAVSKLGGRGSRRAEIATNAGSAGASASRIPVLKLLLSNRMIGPSFEEMSLGAAAQIGWRFACRCYTLVGIAVSVFLMCSLSVAQTGRDAGSVLDRVGIDQKYDAQIPLDLQFRDHTGELVSIETYFKQGKPVILHLVYFRCPMLCKMTLDGLRKSLDTLELSVGEDFTVLTISFDPEEGPELARAARQTMIEGYNRGDMEDGWYFLTGREPDIRQLTNAVGFRYTYDEKRGQYAHAAALIILTPEGHVSRYLFGVEYPPRDLRFSLIDASGGNIGTMSDRALLLCYQYDPTSGKYGFAIMTALRLAGVGTLVVLFGGIFWMLRRDSRKQHLDATGAPETSTIEHES